MIYLNCKVVVPKMSRCGAACRWNVLPYADSLLEPGKRLHDLQAGDGLVVFPEDPEDNGELAGGFSPYDDVAVVEALPVMEAAEGDEVIAVVAAAVRTVDDVVNLEKPPAGAAGHLAAITVAGQYEVS